jgi:hypothetical protein
MSARKPNKRSSIYLGKDGWWHGWVTMGLKDDGSVDRRHRKARTEAEVTRKVRELERKRDNAHVPVAGRPVTRCTVDGDLADNYRAAPYPPLHPG